MNTLHDRLVALSEPLGVAQKELQLELLRTRSQATDLWDDPEYAAQTMSDFSNTQQFLTEWHELLELVQMEAELSDAEIRELELGVKQFEQQALLSGEHDTQSAIVTLHAGAGGVDAQDFAEMLLRMYLRYVEAGKTELVSDRTLSLPRTDWKAEILELHTSEEAGIRRAVIEVSGKNAFGLLKAEAGVHRLVRLSPFNAKSLRQTSFAMVEVIPEVEQSSEISINPEELRIDVFRAGGNGGQGVNTTDSAVRITHLPTNIVVSVQNERSQHQNKATAMKILQSKLIVLQELKNAEEIAILRGEIKENSWGNQIRSYVLHPYQMVKDHRTGSETSNVQAVLDGNLHQFIQEYLLYLNK